MPLLDDINTQKQADEIAFGIPPYCYLIPGLLWSPLLAAALKYQLVQYAEKTYTSQAPVCVSRSTELMKWWGDLS